MKKILCLLLCIMMISGCSKEKSMSTFMVKLNQDNYSLYNQDGKKLTDDTYKTYEENSNRGYLVSDKDNKYGYLNYEGDEIVKMGDYDQLVPTDYMVIAEKYVEKDKKKTIQPECIINSEGKVIFTADKDSILKESGLPIIYNENVWKVLYLDGDDLYKGSEEILYASHDPLYQVYLVGLKDKVIIYHEIEEELQSKEIKVTGEFDIVAVNENGCILQDKKQNSIVLIDLKTMTNQVYDDIKAENIYYDESNNIVIKNGSQISLIARGLKEPIIMNGYYKDVQNYIYRGNDIYGPHILYQDGKLKGNLKDCQVYPAALKFDGSYFPVYVKNKGYQYYDLQGKHPFITVFYEAEAFDKNEKAIVKDKANSVFLIDESGNQITSKKYFDIKYIGSSYYAVYNKNGKFGIINDKGSEILPVEYTSLSSQSVFMYNGNEYLMIEKNGRTYVYDCSHDYDEVFSQEGKTVFNDKGYFIVNDESYYTFEGELIH